MSEDCDHVIVQIKDKPIFDGREQYNYRCMECGATFCPADMARFLWNKFVGKTSSLKTGSDRQGESKCST